MTYDITPDSGEPTSDDLAAIEAEWPLIEAELDLLDAEIAALTAGRSASLLNWRRVRRAERRVLAVSGEVAGESTTTTTTRSAVAS